MRRQRIGKQRNGYKQIVGLKACQQYVDFGARLRNQVDTADIGGASIKLISSIVV